MNSEAENFDAIIESVDTLTDIAKKSIEYLKEDYPVKLDWVNTQLKALNESIAEKSNLIENRTKNMTWLVQNQLTRQIKKVSIEQEKEQEKLRRLEQQKKATDTRIKNLEILIEKIESEKKQYLNEINYYGTKNSIKNLTPEEQKLRYSNALKKLQISRGKEDAARRKLENANEKLVTLDSEITSCKKTIDQNNQTLAQLEDGMQNIEKTTYFVRDLEIKELESDIENKKKQLKELSQLKDILSVDPDDLKLTLIKALEDNDYESISECLNQFEQIISPLLRHQSEIHVRYLDFKQNCTEKSYYNAAARAMDVFQLQRLEFEHELSKKEIDNAELNRPQLENKLSQLLKEYQDVERLILPHEEERDVVLEALSTAYMKDNKKQITNLTSKKDSLNAKITPLQQKLTYLHREYVEVKKQIDFIAREKTTYDMREKEIEKLKSKINEDNYIDEIAKDRDEKELKAMELKTIEIDKTCDLLSTIYSSLKNYSQPQLKNNSMQENLPDEDIIFEDTPDSQNTPLNSQEEMSNDDIIFEDTPEAQENFETSIDVEEEEESKTISERVVAIKDATLDLIKKAGDAVKNSKIATYYEKQREKRRHKLPKNNRQLMKQAKQGVKELPTFKDWEIMTLLEDINEDKTIDVVNQIHSLDQVKATGSDYLALLKRKPKDNVVVKIKLTGDGELFDESESKIVPLIKTDRLVSVDKNLYAKLCAAKAQHDQNIRRDNYGK